MINKKQQGMTVISMVLILGVIAFFATVALRLVPMYQEYFGVVNIMKGMQEEITENKLTKNQANILLVRRFNTGYIDSVKKENIEYLRGSNNVSISKIVIDYEVRVPFMAQISLIGNFHIEAEAEE